VRGRDAEKVIFNFGFLIFDYRRVRGCESSFEVGGLGRGGISEAACVEYPTLFAQLGVLGETALPRFPSLSPAFASAPRYRSGLGETALPGVQRPIGPGAGRGRDADAP
jgi:hypothetical protein